MKIVFPVLKILRDENDYLIGQSRMLKTGYARIYAEIKVVGYFISGIKVVLAGIQAVFGGVMIATMTPVGVAARNQRKFWLTLTANGLAFIAAGSQSKFLDSR